MDNRLRDVSYQKNLTRRVRKKCPALLEILLVGRHIRNHQEWWIYWGCVTFLKICWYIAGNPWEPIAMRCIVHRWNHLHTFVAAVMYEGFPLNPIGSMVLQYMVTWIPSIYPLYVSVYTSTMDPMGMVVFRCNPIFSHLSGLQCVPSCFMAPFSAPLDGRSSMINQCPLVIQHGYGKWPIYRWFMMIYLLKLVNIG